jgi:hypothetical protein
MYAFTNLSMTKESSNILQLVKEAGDWSIDVDLIGKWCRARTSLYDYVRIVLLCYWPVVPPKCREVKVTCRVTINICTSKHTSSITDIDEKVHISAIQLKAQWAQADISTVWSGISKSLQRLHHGITCKWDRYRFCIVHVNVGAANRRADF